MQMIIKTCLVVLLVTSVVRSTVWLRNKNDRGPGAAKSGTKCLLKMVEYYFYDRLLTKIPNIVVLQTKNLTSPSAEIAINSLGLIHGMVGMKESNRFQMRVISDAIAIDGLLDVRTHALTLSDYYVIVVDDLDKLLHRMRHYIVRASAFNPSGRYLILYNNPDFRTSGGNGTDIASKLFNALKKQFNIGKVLFCYASSTMSYDIYITNPYADPRKCELFEPVLLDSCENGVVRNGNEIKMYLRKSHVPRTMSMCTFEICARVSEPYIEKKCSSGLEMEILRVLQSIMDFQTNITCTEMERGEKQKDGNWSDLLGEIISHKCHFVIGGFFPDNDFHGYFGVTSAYLQDTWTWYVAVAPLQTPWKGLIKIFSPNVWILFIIVLIICGFSWNIFGRTMPEVSAHRKIIICLMNTWAVFLGTSANNRPDFTPLRILFIMLALYALTLTSIYTSNLISVFTKPAYDATIDSISKILDAGLPIGGREEYRDWFINDNKQDEIISETYSSAEQFLPSDTNLDRVKNGLQAMLMNRFYVASNKMRNEIYGVPGNVFTNQMEMIAERGFILLPKFNRIINYMTDSGLIDKIHKDFIYNMSILENIKNRNYIETKTVTVLSVRHLEGAFAILIVGELISIVTFMAELISATVWFDRGVRWARQTVSNTTNRILIALKLKEVPKAKVQRRKFNYNGKVFKIKYKNLFYTNMIMKAKLRNDAEREKVMKKRFGVFHSEVNGMEYYE